MTLSFPPSTIYGPVQSWRVGLSLGVDLLQVNSICSFRCVYCQLGKINILTTQRRIFVPTARILGDLQASDWHRAEIITLSGSGEPTLAANLGEVIHEIKVLTQKPVLVLTNSAHLNQQEVRSQLSEADKVFCKVDATDEGGFQRINRPAPGVSFSAVVESIKQFRREYPGFLGIQFMLTNLNKTEVEALAAILTEIEPDEVQINAPSRPVPHEWTRTTRGSHERRMSSGSHLKPVLLDEARQFERSLRNLTKLKIVSPYHLSMASSN